jgi:hypothetical protein
MVQKRSKLQKVKDKHFEMYMSWKSIYCPALKADVKFTRFGWDHLCETKWRTGPEQKRRLEILPLSKKLIGLTTTIQEERNYNGFKTFEFNAVMGGIKVFAIVSKKNSDYIFLSNFREY